MHGTVIPDPDKPVKVLPDGRGLFVHSMTFGKGRLYVGQIGVMWYDDGW